MTEWTLVTETPPIEVARDHESALLLSLRSLRGDRSLEEAAGQVGIRADELSRIERGLTKQIRWETLLRIMRTYQCRPEEILMVKDNIQDDWKATPRELMLATMEAGQKIPARHLRLDEQSTGLSEASVDTLAAPIPRSPIRRKFKPVSTR